MDLFVEKLEEFLQKKTTIVKSQVDKENEEKMKLKEAVGEQGLTYDMNKFLKSVKQFEADRAKKSKKRIKDYEDI